jgi:hypothetical protein
VRELPTGLPALAPGKVAWAIWTSLVLGQAVFAGVILLGGLHGIASEAGPVAQGLLPWIGLGLLATTAPVGFLVRKAVWDRAEHDGYVPPRPWLTGNVVLWAMLEAPSLFGLVVVMLEGPGGTRLVAPALGFALQVLVNPGSSSDRLPSSVTRS